MASTRIAVSRNDGEPASSLEHLSALYQAAMRTRMGVDLELRAARDSHARVVETRDLAKPAMMTACGLGALALTIPAVAASFGVPCPWSLAAIGAGFWVDHALPGGPPRKHSSESGQEALGTSQLLIALAVVNGNHVAGIAAGLAAGAGLSRAFLAAQRLATPPPSTREIETLETRRAVAVWDEQTAKAERDEHPLAFLERCAKEPSPGSKPPQASA